MPDPLEQAIAEAFRAWPRDDDGTLTGLRLSDAVRVAHTAAAAHVAHVEAETAGVRTHLDATEALVAGIRTEAAARIDAAGADYQAHADALGDELAALRHAAHGHSARYAALEAVLVQARARWDIEGGPDVLRDAIAAAEATRG